MVRIVWITALMAILCIVLYLPSASPPERFIEVLRAEHAVHREVWGPAVADRILGRMLDMQQDTPPLSEPPAPTVQAGQMSAMDAAVAAQVSQMSVRLFGNPYFRSIDSLFALATYRLSAMIAVWCCAGSARKSSSRTALRCSAAASFSPSCLAVLWRCRPLCLFDCTRCSRRCACLRCCSC